MPKKLIAIIGYTAWGKSNTLYTLFDRKRFFPLKSSIWTENFPSKRFTVIEASNEDRSTEEYLNRLKTVLKKHKNSETIFTITISLIFNRKKHDVMPVFNYLNSLADFSIIYIVLKKSWYKNQSLQPKDIAQMKNKAKANRIKYFDEMINESKKNFNKRTEKIAKFIDK